MLHSKQMFALGMIDSDSNAWGKFHLPAMPQTQLVLVQFMINIVHGMEAMSTTLQCSLYNQYHAKQMGH